ncbi:MAG: DegV family protein [Eubacteriales bacterium]|nr:DegV family protein [Eubacteriales bacterium]MDY4214558.1 DegV family protein [Eubacteriales bacterium]
MIKIVTDSAADIPKSIAEELDIEILPFMINIDGKQIVADKNLTPQEFYKMVENCVEIPSTSQMSPADLEDIYRKIGAEDTIIHITMSARGSGINNTSNLVAAQLNDEGFDITVIDSGKFTMIIGDTVIKAAKMARSGASKQEIIDFANENYARDTAYFLVDDLTFLKKGGRIKATTMAISKVLDIKPILFINDGLVEATRKVRGLKKSLSVLVDFIEERMENPEENEVMILDSDAPDKVEVIEEMIRERIKPKAITYAKIGPVITCHAGPGLVGVYFKHKKPYTEYDK